MLSYTNQLDRLSYEVGLPHLKCSGLQRATTNFPMTFWSEGEVDVILLLQSLFKRYLCRVINFKVRDYNETS